MAKTARFRPVQGQSDLATLADRIAAPQRAIGKRFEAVRCHPTAARVTLTGGPLWGSAGRRGGCFVAVNSRKSGRRATRQKRRDPALFRGNPTLRHSCPWRAARS